MGYVKTFGSHQMVLVFLQVSHRIIQSGQLLGSVMERSNGVPVHYSGQWFAKAHLQAKGQGRIVAL